MKLYLIFLKIYKLLFFSLQLHLYDIESQQKSSILNYCSYVQVKVKVFTFLVNLFCFILFLLNYFLMSLFFLSTILTCDCIVFIKDSQPESNYSMNLRIKVQVLSCYHLIYIMSYITNKCFWIVISSIFIKYVDLLLWIICLHLILKPEVLSLVACFIDSEVLSISISWFIQTVNILVFSFLF